MLFLSFISSIIELDKTIFINLNGIHSTYTDYLFFVLSERLVWIPLYLWMIYKVYTFYPQKFFTIIVVAILMIAVSESFCSVVKDLTMRLRPCHDPQIFQFVHLGLAKCGGKYGFYSAHASNHFAISIFTTLIFKEKIKNYPLFINLWAISIGYSRIALGAHFPGDVIVGSIIGIFWGLLFYKIYNKFINKITQNS